MLVNNPANPDILRTRSKGACSTIIGFLVLAGGITVSVLPFFVEGIEESVAAVMGIGTILAAIGFCFLFGRNSLIFDRRQRLVSKRLSIVFTISNKTWSFDGLSKVLLTKEVHRSKNSTYISYPVDVVGSEKTVRVGNGRDYLDARRSAEQVAGFVMIPVHDESTGETVVREPEHLNEPLVARIRRLGEDVSVPQQPATMMTTVDEQPSKTTITIPAPGPNPILLVIAIAIIPMVVAPLAIAFIRFRGKANLPWPFILIPLLFVAVPLSILGARILKDVLGQVTITISPESLLIRTKSPTGEKEQCIPAEELEELLLPVTGLPENIPPAMAGLLPQRGLILCSDKLMVEVGNKLPSPEKEYLVAYITEALLRHQP